MQNEETASCMLTRVPKSLTLAFVLSVEIHTCLQQV
jgi:hypothetical protein